MTVKISCIEQMVAQMTQEKAAGEVAVEWFGCEFVTTYCRKYFHDAVLFLLSIFKNKAQSPQRSAMRLASHLDKKLKTIMRRCIFLSEEMHFANKEKEHVTQND